MKKLNKVIINKVIDWVAIKFLIVGVINTLIGSVIMFTFYNLFHLSYWFSTASNYIVGSIMSYILNKYWTFQNKEKSNKTIIRFIFNILICYFLAYGIAKPLVSWLMRGFTTSVRDNVSMITGMVLFTGFNYMGQRFFTFKQEVINQD